jgi:predicted alpha/beta-fold hydrolase
MPLLESSYCPPSGFANGHVQTIFPVLFRRVPVLTTTRERIGTPDGDFLDIDWNTDHRSERVAILTHGLEGSARNSCIQGMARAFHRAGWDILAWNLRGCSGQPNRLIRSYHSGSTEDLEAVISQVPPRCTRIALVGFSLGGNITLKYLGDHGEAADPRIAGAAAFSVPCDLASSARQLEAPLNRIYMRHFLQGLRRKVIEKSLSFPERIETGSLRSMRTFEEFDGAYTAPWNGFASAADYWRRASSKPVLGGIARPTLLVNALNDPFLPPECFPESAARQNPHLHLETPRSGGHAGFITFNRPDEYWSESRAVQFLNRLL